jgi:uncharacterized protein
MQKIEVLYIPPSLEICRILVDYRPNMTVAEVLSSSNIYALHPETQNLPCGIYGRVVNLDTVVSPGARVEIYRPLQIDPKEKRRLKARHAKG